MANAEPPVSYLSPKLVARANLEKGGMGVFAREPVFAGELLVVWSGELFTSATLATLPSLRRQRSIQIEEDLYMVPTRIGESADFVNHSCNPNAGIEGQIGLRAMRDIAVGEEICYDYAMSDGSPYDEFVCGCGTLNCRQRITGEDWRQPELQARYAGWFSPYLQRRIHQLQQTERLIQSQVNHNHQVQTQ